MNMASGPVSRGSLRRIHLSGPARRRITLLALALAANLNADSLPENLRQNGWFIGAQAYTFKEFSAFEAIAKTKEAGGNVIEFFDAVGGNGVFISNNNRRIKVAGCKFTEAGDSAICLVGDFNSLRDGSTWLKPIENPQDRMVGPKTPNYPALREIHDNLDS